MILNGKISTTKLYNASRSTTFVLVIFPYDFVWTVQILNFKILELRTKFWGTK